ncbi:hypothetical protein AGOR_G00103430 [Albula goreensis]|uniref:Potassium channel domain-containing protein n=1 Tax=Albula goreensis TaxID=1534307 RepID=A0A8T3DCI1_9TELE|nr:hypothetical protein AGOR_G00103430 [Albula goreensis]
MARLQITSMKVSWTGLLVLAHFLYLLLGATIFQMLEREAERNNRDHFKLEKLRFLMNYSCLDGPALEKFVQVFCVFYALCGIPLNLAFLNQLGKCLTLHLGRLERGVVSVGQHKRLMEVLALASFLLMGSTLFLVIPPLVFSYVEGWSYGEGFYFAFITLSTIGFGDYVVGTDPDKHYISVYRSLAGVWIIFGLAWLALLFNMGARVMEHVFQLRNHAHKAQNQEELPEKQEDGVGQRAIQQGL